VIVLGIIVLVIIVSMGIAASRQRADRLARKRADREVRAALQGDVASVRAQSIAVGRQLCQASTRYALAAVQACRATGSRDVATILVALFGHPSSAVASAAAAATNDLGGFGLRTAWEAKDHAQGIAATRLQGFLVQHPDWLFEQLMERFATEGVASIQANHRWWSTPGVRQRLELLAATSDAINRQRAATILSLLSPSADVA